LGEKAPDSFAHARKFWYLSIDRSGISEALKTVLLVLDTDELGDFKNKNKISKIQSLFIAAGPGSQAGAL
jgi:hypothetical protein